MASVAAPQTAVGGFDARRIDRYVLAAFTAAALAVSMLVVRETSPLAVVLVALPPSFFFGFVALAARYPSRAMPLRTSRVPFIVMTHLGAAAVVTAVWILLWRSWALFLTRVTDLQLQPLTTPRTFSLMAGAGVLLYLGAVVVQYLVAEAATSSEALQTALRYQLLAREAELKAFKSQINPHFLFNSLNAISSLCGSSPADARRMSQLLADFFRMTLRVSMLERISLEDEIGLARNYLEIERIRFGPRLMVEIDLEPAAAGCQVPPLMLQPLVENSVRHGVAHLLEGGRVQLSARIRGGELHITLQNPVDPDQPGTRGEGIGLANVRGRIAAFYAGAGSITGGARDGMFRIDITAPCVSSDAGRKES